MDLSIIDEPRVLAIASTPAEAAPNATIGLYALLVDEHGVRDDALRWSMCTARRPLAELGPFANACTEDPDVLVALGTGPNAGAEIPGDACRLFGPDPPPTKPGEPQGRPAEADRTGGYYLPIVVDAVGELATFGVRIDCGVDGATQAQALELRMRHRDNLVPAIEELARIDDDSGAIAEDAVLEVEAGAEVELRVRWPACEAETSCGGAEWYPRFDPVVLDIVESREAMSVSWYATAGELDVARTGRESDDEARTSENTWIAPTSAGDVTLWIVLRDDRGGASWRTLLVTVVE